ncbi:ornithine cyclodeaminase family protein [Arthrobacter sp. G119Y2]|uniref:ornithine cyclodeaminase family protein n=1 Tax=Arthrobacter sp. G119Y2 TaxID=3134965 RepID=UPI003119A372
MTIPYYDGAAVRAAAPFPAAVTALENALRSSVDPEEDSPRLFSPSPAGEFLIMPTSGARYSGVKVLTVAPSNPELGLNKIQGVYVLFDSSTSAPLATMDGTELTAVRTPATTLLAVRHMAEAAPVSAPFPTDPLFVVFGAGVQALNHIRAARALFPTARFAVVGRRPDRVRGLIRELDSEGIAVTEGTEALVPEADVLLCLTTSTIPLFDGSLPAANAIVASVGQHGLDAREVDATLVLRSDVVVEGRASAWRESGDLIPARSVAQWQQMPPVNLRELVQGKLVRTPGRPCLYSGVGMAWQDLVTAALVFKAPGSTS